MQLVLGPHVPGCTVLCSRRRGNFRKSRQKNRSGQNIHLAHRKDPPPMDGLAGRHVNSSSASEQDFERELKLARGSGSRGKPACLGEQTARAVEYLSLRGCRIFEIRAVRNVEGLGL